MNIEIANNKEFFYQWDTGQMLQITDDGSGSEVHIEKDTLTLACAIREENGVRLVDVPDLLLQVDGHLTAFLVHKVEDEVETLFSKTFQIKHRAKPVDYVCTETEILHYRDLAERITALEQNGGSTGGGIAQETDPTVPAWAKADTKPTYTAAEVGALPADTKIPTVPDKVSAFSNDAGYVTAEDLPTVPTALPNPNKLTFSGAVEAEYDGSGAVEVVIPDGGGSEGSELTLLASVTLDDTTAGATSYTFTDAEYPGISNCRYIFAEVCLPASVSTNWVKLKLGSTEATPGYGGGTWLYLVLTAENFYGRISGSCLAGTNNAAGQNIARGTLQSKYTTGIYSPAWPEFSSVTIMGNNFAPVAGTIIRIWGAKA